MLILFRPVRSSIILHVDSRTDPFPLQLSALSSTFLHTSYKGIPSICETTSKPPFLDPGSQNHTGVSGVPRLPLRISLRCFLIVVFVAAFGELHAFDRGLKVFFFCLQVSRFRICIRLEFSLCFSFFSLSFLNIVMSLLLHCFNLDYRVVI